MEFLGALIALAVIVFFFYVVIRPFIEIGVDVSKSTRHDSKVKKVKDLQTRYPDAYEELKKRESFCSWVDEQLDKLLSHPEYEWASIQHSIEDKFNRQCQEINDYNARIKKINDICIRYPHAYRQILGKKQIEHKTVVNDSWWSSLAETVASNPEFGKVLKDDFPFQSTKPKRVLPERDTCIAHLSESEKTTLLNTPTERLELLEKEIVDEINRKQEEVERKYSELETKYPNGIRLYKKKHPETSDKERIITLSKEIFASYEENYRIAQYYSQWHDAQVQFSKEMRDLRDTKLKDWGCYYYNAQVQGHDEYGNPKSLDFKIWQMFCESFCSSQSADYSLYPTCKKNYDNLDEFRKGKRHFNNWVYDTIIEFIKGIPGKPLVNFADSGMGDAWSALEYYHFGYLKQKLNENQIPFTSEEYLTPNHTLHKGSVVFIELISNNSRLREICSEFLQKSSGENLTIVFLTLLKEYDENEFLSIVKRKEQEIKEAAEKQKKEKEEKERREREEAERKVREAKEAEEKRKREEAERKQREEKEFLHRVSHTLKPNASAFKNYLLSNGVRYFYHFTDRRNLESIKRMGGLYSWRYCEEHDISIPYPGGDGTSRSLDSRHGLSDYVRLSFCTDHPMKWVLEQKGYNMVLLRVKIDVACLEGTLFSDINATDNNHQHGGTLEDLKRINISATQQNYVGRDSDIFKQHQAEVMVKTFIPLEYIEMSGLVIDSTSKTIFPGNSGYRPISDSYRQNSIPSDDLPF